MSDKLKEVATKLDEIETCIADLRNNIKNVIDYVQEQCVATTDKIQTTGDEEDEQNN
tara:strand:+ start:795 stop:965 length:171 start_codon:yes stop_codon:yes gene_type:complete